MPKRIGAKLYKELDNGNLFPLGDGDCWVYETKGNNTEGYISFNFGKLRAHFSKEEFKQLCRQVLAHNHLLLEGKK